MTFSQPNSLELAKHGDTEALTAFINQSLESTGATAKVGLKEKCLKVMLEANPVPEQQVMVALILNNLKTLTLQGCNRVKISGREIGDDFPDWQQDCEFEEQIVSTLPDTEIPAASEKSSLLGSIFGAVAGAAGAVGGAATYAGSAVVGTVAGAAGSVGGAVAGAAGAVGGAATYAGGAVVDTVAGAAGAVGGAALQVTDGIGYVVNMVSDSPHLQELTKALQLDRLIEVAARVDVVKAEKHVKNLQTKYPNEKPNEIAHRVIADKAFYVGGSGFATSLLPGFAAGLFAVDLAATTALQAEMVYQIACAYGLDPHEPARKGEVMAIFGLALGGNSALKAGLGLARNIPIAGALVGASSNAAMLYGLGYAACRFYEAKLSPKSSQPDWQTAQVQSEQYLQGAILQQIIMDQILMHVILAGIPGKNWKQLLPELPSFNFSPASQEAIVANADSPPSLEILLTQISHDFAIPLVAQCQKIVQQDGVVTPEEAKMIATITSKLNINLTSMV